MMARGKKLKSKKARGILAGLGDDLPDGSDEGPTEEQILAGLNETQRAAATTDARRALVCAVAGSGKTRLLTHRIARLILILQVTARSILATTFSRRAAGEMNARLKQLGVDTGNGGARVGTFHSVCLEIIRDGSPWAHYQVDGAEDEETGRRQSMRMELKKLLGWSRDGSTMNWRGCDLTDVESYIGLCKQHLVQPGDPLPPEMDRYGQPQWRADRRYAEAYSRYEDRREQLQLLTFDDMLSSAVYYLREDIDARHRWQGRFQHILVDEFQDSNAAQYELVRLLLGPETRLMCVGDDDQLVYSWRGSMPEYTVGFEQAHEGAEIFRMESNYRSHPDILVAANNTIRNNQIRIPKVNRPEREAQGGDAIEFARVADMDVEAAHVATRIQQHVTDGGKLRDCVILYRTNAQSRALEEAFMAAGIPHEVVGGTDFYRRKEVADILAYLRVAVDESDDKAAERSVNRPFRYIGKVTIEQAKDRGGRGRLYQTLTGGRLDVRRNQERSLDTYRSIVERLQADLADEQLSLTDCILRLIKASGYEDWIVSDEGTDTAENSRLSNLRELARTAGRFASAEAFLAHVDELARQKRKPKKERDLVLLMTIHKSKGLEWPVVFVVGVSDGILPHGRSNNQEEERRLWYVAVTRAQDRLCVTSPAGALINGKLRDLPLSPFVVESDLIKDRDGMIIQ